MNIDLKSLLSRTTILKVVAVILALFGVAGGVATVPKMAGPSGASPNEFLNMAIPLIGGAVTWFAANWFKVSPEMVSAILALAKNPQDKTAWIRVTMGLSVFLKSQFPNSKAVVTLDLFSRQLHDELLGVEPVATSGAVFTLPDGKRVT